MIVSAPENKVKFSQELKEHFKNLNLSFFLYPLKEEKTYKSLNSFYDFVKKQRDYWDGFSIGRTGQINNNFSSILGTLNDMETYQEDNLSHAINLLSNVVNQIKHNGFPNVFISPEADFIKEQYKLDPIRADAVCDYFFGTEQLNVSIANKGVYNGLISAFFYKYPNLQGQMFKNLDNEFEALKNRYVESLNNVDAQYYDKMEQLTENNTTFKDGITLWKEDLVTTTQEFVQEKQTKLEELERLYEEKLKLEAPAKYWEEASHEYEKKGEMWIIVTAVTTIIFIGFLSFLLFKMPGNVAGLNFNSLKLTIILTVIISAGLFLINFFIRLATSAFHLSRDAKERNKLTYVYLALLKDKSVEETDRSIILQSLFSRADTGLLKGDSSPTLPDGLVGQVIKTFGQQK
ncbi:DUF6161 domain-containing protein [Mesobacillus zeae]|uniref:DUF6161 domain-containing protein n=1 Tax=Mesobacillus zeae TaxID=1917180 RepID=UPI00300AF55C